MPSITGYRSYICRLIALVLLAACGLLEAASTQSYSGPVNLAVLPSPSVAQAGVTSVNLIGTNFPSGTLEPSQIQIALTPAVEAVISFSPLAVTKLFGSTYRLTFIIPSSFNVSFATDYFVSLSGQTLEGTPFSSAANRSQLTVEPAAQITSLSPNSALVGQSLTITLSANNTNFVQGATQANFGPDISVGPVTVIDQTTATVQLTVSSNAATGSRSVTVTTGREVVSLPNGFTINSNGGTPPGGGPCGAAGSSGVRPNCG